MFSRRDEFGLIVVIMLIIILAVLIRSLIKYKKRQLRIAEEAERRRAQQEQNIFNISSRIPQTPGQYPDAFLSTEHITIANELNKPPKYDDAPPSYEEAIKLAMAQSNSLQTLQAEQTYSANQGPSSTSLSTTTVVPALPSRTTE